MNTTKKSKTYKQTITLLIATVASLFLFGQGCFFGPPSGPLELGSGDLRVAWSFGGDVCPVDVVEVVVEVRTPGGARVLSDIVLNCTEGVGGIPALAEGDYVVLLKGLDVDRAITWESGARNIYVASDTTAEVTVELAPAL